MSHFKNLYKELKQKALKHEFNRIASAIEKTQQIDRIRLVSLSRKREIVDCRFIAFYLLKNTGASCKEIGKLFNKVNHATILNGLKEFEFNVLHNEAFKQMFDAIFLETLKNKEPFNATISMYNNYVNISAVKKQNIENKAKKELLQQA